MAAATAQADILTGRVVGVTDGDTITVLDHTNTAYKIRLGGIDAPERKQPFGQASKRVLSDAIYGKPVVVEWTKHDRYGRIIGKVLDSQRVDVCLMQVATGFAWHYKKYANEQSPEDREAYTAAEEAARDARRGLWADSAPTPPWEWRHQQRRSKQ